MGALYFQTACLDCIPCKPAQDGCLVVPVNADLHSLPLTHTVLCTAGGVSINEG